MITKLRAWFDRGVLSLLSATATVLITLNAFVTRGRMSHENGIVVRGRVKLVDDPRFPAHPFFSSGRDFPCRLRHASVSYLDDAALVVRGTGLKFADTDYESPLDLLMNTGEAAPFYDAWTFVQFMYLTIRGRNPHAISYMKKYPLAARGVQVSLRRNPESFARMSYYSKTPFRFDADDGVPRYVKFRMLPEHDGPESGIPDAKSLQRPWEQQPEPGEDRSQTYLKDEYRRRVESEGAHYRLELQLHPMHPDEHREVILNASIAWDEAAHPWYPLGSVEIDEVLSFEEGNRSRFTPSNHPPSMGFIKPLSIHDPPSLDLLRERGIWARRARLLGYRIFGMPGESSDVRGDPSKVFHSDFVLQPPTTVLQPHDRSAEATPPSH
jgi:catalase